MPLKTATLRATTAGALLGVVLAVASCATSEANGKVTVVRPREAVSLIESGRYVVLDLRSAEAFAAGHVVGARSAPFLDGGFKRQLPGLDPNKRYLLYAKDPEVVRRAADVMVALDFRLVVDAGRFGLLALAGAPIE